MLAIVRKMVKSISTSKGAKITVAVWLGAIILLSVFAPSAKDYENNSTEGSVRNDKPSEIADQLLEDEFPTEDGLTGLIVFHQEKGLNEEDIEKIETFSKWLQSDEKPTDISSALPFHEFPKEVQAQMFSEDKSTLLFNLALKANVDAVDAFDVFQQVNEKWDAIGSDTIQFEITGPAGITSDTTALFKNADFVLMLATVGLIFIILIFIYRSPLLAIMPLVIAGIVYGVVDRVLGLLGKFDIFVIDGQATSIMLVLLFAVITDYSLFIFSRFREELYKYESKYGAMKEAIYHVSEPIFFSGGTVILAILSLFVTVFKPYNYFAPVFTVAVLFILLAGLTLIPAIFALLGRRAFWPSVPKLNDEKKEKHTLWSWISNIVVKRPKMITLVLSIFLLVGTLNIIPINFSFNLLKSFPEDISSRVGFELLEENYPPGELAPVDILVKTKNNSAIDKEFLEHIQSLQEELEVQNGVSTVNSKITDGMIRGEEDLSRNFLAESEKAVKFQLILSDNPYDHAAIDTIEKIRENTDKIVTKSGFDTDAIEIHLAGQTASQLDVKQMNVRDMVVLFTLVVVLLTIVLGFQTRSILLPVIMMGTILLSYAATLGFSWVIFHHLLGYEEISYRIPVYTFIFMVALGIDYNIMLVSRVKEFAAHYDWTEAVGKGVTFTGGVISSAGLILAATFSVLITQPIQELFLFGTIMAFGILLDTFIIRGFYLPSLLILTHPKK
ncbi:MMPL family transporter [Pseudogracilibacillus sp. SE30717A]|uniref:MMPL family transporter n=1 Tax=Pseudogracilibacillus sp. SE30717A TaxID=3098293 RepID=UPI00300DE3C8